MTAIITSMNHRKLTTAAWIISASTLLLAAIAWLQTYPSPRLEPYALFPALGLVAFSLMWTHYIAGALRRYYHLQKSDLQSYFDNTSAVVLFAILLHPGLLIVQLWKDGLGLPPASYLEHYVAPTAAWAAMLGSVSLLIFLGFELRHIYGQKSWWKYVGHAQSAAMVAIYIHALRLGGILQLDWFRAVWYLYGAGLIIALGYSIYKDHLTKEDA